MERVLSAVERASDGRYFVQPGDFEIKQVPVPKIGPDDVLLKGMSM